MKHLKYFYPIIFLGALMLWAFHARATGMCADNETELKGQQGTTCVIRDYFATKQNWSQGELAKSAPANDGTCPGRYAYKDDQGFTLFCWGKQ